MGSLKLDKGSSVKEQILGAGFLLLVLGVIVAFLASKMVGLVMVVLGILLLVVKSVEKK